MRRTERSRGIGLYTYEQVKNTTPFQYFAQIVVGAVVAATGGLLVYYWITVHDDEVQKYGSAEIHIWGWLGSLAVIVIGLLMAHAGIIFYARRAARKISILTDKTRRFENRHDR